MSASTRTESDTRGDPASIGTVTRGGLHHLLPVHHSVAAATQAHLDQFDG